MIITKYFITSAYVFLEFFSFSSDVTFLAAAWPTSTRGAPRRASRRLAALPSSHRSARRPSADLAAENALFESCLARAAARNPAAFEEGGEMALPADAEGVALLEVYCAEEERRAERVVIQEAHWTVLVPYWAMWPFETLLLPRRQIDHLDALTESEQL